MTRIPVSRFKPKECFCTVSDCGKCLFLNCTNDECKIHRLITKLRYRQRQLQRFIDFMANMEQAEDHDKKRLSDLKHNASLYRKEVQRIESVLSTYF